jgi:hypothetical protein
MEQPDILKNGVLEGAGRHNAWIGHAAAGGYDLRSQFVKDLDILLWPSCRSDHVQAIP